MEYRIVEGDTEVKIVRNSNVIIRVYGKNDTNGMRFELPEEYIIPLRDYLTKEYPNLKEFDFTFKG